MSNYFHGNDFHLKKVDAVHDVIKRFNLKEASLEKQLKQLEAKRTAAFKVINDATL